MNAIEKLFVRAPDLEFYLPDGAAAVKLSLMATFYFGKGYTTESKQRVMECFNRFYSEFGPQLKGQFQDKYKKLTPDSFNEKLEKSWRPARMSNMSGSSLVPPVRKKSRSTACPF